MPGDLPKCKDFALVTLTHKDDVSWLLEHWPWMRVHTPHESDVPQPEREASMYGFRAISKARWEHFCTEYLQWRRTLLDSISDSERGPVPTQAVTASIPGPSPSDISHTKTTLPEGSSNGAAVQDSPALYPTGCLVHARHVHPETNKTTLRKLFSQAFTQDTTKPGHGINYVDFNKGMDAVSHCTLQVSERQTDFDLNRSAIYDCPLQSTQRSSWHISPKIPLFRLVASMSRVARRQRARSRSPWK